MSWISFSLKCRQHYITFTLYMLNQAMKTSPGTTQLQYLHCHTHHLSPTAAHSQWDTSRWTAWQIKNSPSGLSWQWDSMRKGLRASGWAGEGWAAAAAAMWMDHIINKQISGEDKRGKREVGHKNKWNLDHAKGIVLATANWCGALLMSVYLRVHTHTLHEETGPFGCNSRFRDHSRHFLFLRTLNPPPVLLEKKTPRR